jgi:hypothetical protein
LVQDPEKPHASQPLGQICQHVSVASSDDVGEAGIVVAPQQVNTTAGHLRVTDTSARSGLERSARIARCGMLANISGALLLLAASAADVASIAGTVSGPPP